MASNSRRTPIYQVHYWKRDREDVLRIACRERGIDAIARPDMACRIALHDYGIDPSGQLHADLMEKLKSLWDNGSSQYIADNFPGFPIPANAALLPEKVIENHITRLAFGQTSPFLQHESLTTSTTSAKTDLADPSAANLVTPPSSSPTTSSGTTNAAAATTSDSTVPEPPTLSGPKPWFSRRGQRTVEHGLELLRLEDEMRAKQNAGSLATPPTHARSLKRNASAAESADPARQKKSPRLGNSSIQDRSSDDPDKAI